MIIQPVNTLNYGKIIGASLSAFSLVLGSLVLFVIPGACSFVGAGMLLILALSFIAGLVIFGVSFRSRKHPVR